MEGEVSAGEPFSPELALVCPELRARALAELPDPEWAAVVAQVRVRTKIRSAPLPRRRLAHLPARDMRMAALQGVFLAVVSLLTWTLTLIAEAVR